MLETDIGEILILELNTSKILAHNETEFKKDDLATFYKLSSVNEVIGRIDPIESAKLDLAKIDRVQVRNCLIRKKSLDRMHRIRPRSIMSAGVISENGNLIDRNLQEINLKDSHRQRLVDRRYRFGDFFWVRPEFRKNVSTGDQQKTGVFLLDTPKLQASAFVMDTNTGEVLANFGGYEPVVWL